MEFTIIAIVVLFFLGRKLNNHTWLQATCFAGTFLAAIALFVAFLGINRFIGFICACVLTYALIFLATHTAPVSSNKVDEKDVEQFAELIRFVSFAQKLAPLARGNYGIRIVYEFRENSIGGNRLYATFGFYDFDEIRFAREFALEGRTNMVHHYYEDITQRAELDQKDWPYRIDAYDFSDVLCGKYGDYFTVIPDSNEDIYAFKIVGGFDSRNALQVSTIVSNLLKAQFPSLQIEKEYAHKDSMQITIKL